MNAMREQSLSVWMDIEVASDAAPLASRAALARIISAQPRSRTIRSNV